MTERGRGENAERGRERDRKLRSTHCSCSYNSLHLPDTLLNPLGRLRRHDLYLIDAAHVSAAVDVPSQFAFAYSRLHALHRNNSASRKFAK